MESISPDKRPMASSTALDNWVARQQNYSEVDQHCEFDHQCDCACRAIYSENDTEIVKYVCNRNYKRCSPVTVSTQSCVMAIEDLEKLNRRVLKDKEDAP